MFGLEGTKSPSRSNGGVKAGALTQPNLFDPFPDPKPDPTRMDPKRGCVAFNLVIYLVV